MIETRVTAPRMFRRLAVDFPEIAYHRFDGGEERIEIDAIETDATITRMNFLIEIAQPADEIEHVGIAPHPRRKANEIGERIDRLLVVADAANVAIHAIRIGPVGFDGDDVESALGDQSLRDLRAIAIELVRAV